MKRIFLTSLFLTIVLSGIAQYNYQSQISPAGDFYESTNFNISWTLGEVAVETLVGSNFILTQGFQQSELTIIGIDESLLDNDNSIIIYPNPSYGIVYLIINRAELKTEQVPNRYLIYDIQGKLLNNEKIVETKTLIDLRQYSGSLYYVKLFNTESHYSTTHIIQKLN